MKSITTFDIVLMPFPFTDLSATKRRPVLILHAFEWPKLPPHYLVAMVTSQTDALKFPEDVRLGQWKEAGLPKASLVRLGKLVTLDGSLLIKKLGRLATTDQTAIKRMFKRHYSHLVSA